ncbi:hypothetical protein Airi01_096580 [Actinoallomurus iriomotensis]|uniref:Uncharacterized protein n=1 Tax=Actinoallomurus iriomotensis TaxID=478107 RepID=A0A9W6RT43_9ACTN|nr:hypothetical protein Airi01_096580 [Actinoallomurus iriomotensis]
MTHDGGRDALLEFDGTHAVKPPFVFGVTGLSRLRGPEPPRIGRAAGGPGRPDARREGGLRHHRPPGRHAAAVKGA